MDGSTSHSDSAFHFLMAANVTAHKKHEQSTRRDFLQYLFLGSVSLPLLHSLEGSASATPIEKLISANPFTAEEDRFLEELERANCRFFWEQSDPQSGLTRDRCRVTKDAGSDSNAFVGSIAATGFGLTALCIGQKRGFIPGSAALQRTLATLRFLASALQGHRGFFYHFVSVKDGQRVWDSEVSPIDTAILLCGVLTCREFYQHPEVINLADKLFNRVEWPWVAEDTPLLSQGWTPETGFLPTRWNEYSELMMIYLLGLGSATHPLAAETWDAWKRMVFEYDGMRYVGSFAPLFVHQYSQGWFDFRGKRDRYADYFENSISAVDIHRRFCLELAKRFPDYSEDLWGITASDSQQGYVIWGGPPSIGPIDGTVVPSAAAGSLPFAPAAAIRVLKTIKNRYPEAWSQYGFVNAFNPLKKWYDSDVIGLDAGITMVMAENARTGFVWKTFMKSVVAQRGLRRAGFREYTRPRK